MKVEIDKYITRPRVLKDLVYHDLDKAKKEIGLPYRYIDNSMVKEADVNVGLQEIKQVVPDFSYVEPHTHDVSQFYGIIGDLKIEVTIEEEKREIEGPASIFIPAGKMHTFRPISGTGYVMIILRKGVYE